MSDVHSFAAYAARARKDAGMTQRMLAAVGRLNIITVSSMERGTNVPYADTVVAWADAVGVNSDEALLAAGYAPRSVPPEDLLQMLCLHRSQLRVCPALHDRLRAVLDANLAPRQQLDLATILEEFLEVCGKWAIHSPYSPQQNPKRDPRYNPVGVSTRHTAAGTKRTRRS